MSECRDFQIRFPERLYSIEIKVKKKKKKGEEEKERPINSKLTLFHEIAGKCSSTIR